MITQLAWITDPHLNFVDEPRIAQLMDEIRATGADAVLVGGDMGEADSFARYLEKMAAELERPIYFVLGNHDYYRGSIAKVRRAARELSSGASGVTWLPACQFVEMGRRTALVGHDCWGDGRNGDFLASNVVLNDYLLIQELQARHDFPENEQILTPALLEKLHSLGDEAAEHLREAVTAALRVRDHVIVLTHVPPFHEACWYEGQPSDSNWAPHFSCQAAGKVLAELMSLHPHKQMTVLCGHTHSPGEVRILSNLLVLTGQARYGEPTVQQVLKVE